MLSVKPWKLDLVLLFGAMLMVSLFVGLAMGQAIVALYHVQSESDQMFIMFTLSATSFQGVALVLTHHFLKLHGLTWSEFLGLSSPHRVQWLWLALGAALILLPGVLLLNGLSAKILTWVDVETADQAAVQVMKGNEEFGRRIWFAVLSIGIVPFAEEIVFRGILYPTIKQLGYPGLALWGTSLLFAAIHLSLAIFLPLTVLALALTWLYEKTEMLAVPILVHAVFNAVNFFIFLSQNG